jgi:hypothetical protein
MTDDEMQNTLAQARATQSVLTSLLIVLQKRGEVELVKEAFDLAGETYTVASLSKDKALRTRATRVLQVVDDMRKAVIRNNPPRKTV